MKHVRIYDFFASVCAYWRTEFASIAALSPAERVRQRMFWVFWLYLVIFAAGYWIRDVFPPLCLIFLVMYYRLDWHNSTLRRLPVWWLFVVFYGLAVWGVVWSQNIYVSFMHILFSLNKAFILPFIAVECVRDTKDLRRLMWALAFAVFWQGCNGIWQYITGYDFINSTPLVSGRLTGSLIDYRVGNYIALMLIPASGIWYILREKISWQHSLGICSLLLGPGLFLLYFSYTRNAFFTIFVAMIAWLSISGKNLLWTWARITGVTLCALAFIYIRPFAVGRVFMDGRWQLWEFALAIFQESPWAGVGFRQYNAALRQLGLTPVTDPITVTHPHNIYLQLLCESGIIGLTLGCIFLFGMACWGWRRIRPALLQTSAKARMHKASLHYRLTALLWCGWVAYLFSGIAGHDFYRDWWQAMVMQNLGIMLGALVCGVTKSNSR